MQSPPATIFISGDLSLNEASGVIIHELAHRLHFGPRYQEENFRRHFNYDASAFHEALARIIENEWRELGGDTFHKNARRLFF